MNDHQIKDLLTYHQPLDDAAFKQRILTQIRMAEKKRRNIMVIFTLLGLASSAIYLWSALPVGVIPNLLTPINGLLFSAIGLFVVWLWTDMLSDT